MVDPLDWGSMDDGNVGDDLGGLTPDQWDNLAAEGAPGRSLGVWDIHAGVFDSAMH
ncbi:MAG: hypothetical protein GY835_24550 [bacterium]|nr:hypothetical protein [bacterium]